MVTRRVKTGGAYVGAGGLGAPSPPQWQNTYEDQEFTGSYVADPGGGPDQWQYSSGFAYYIDPSYAGGSPDGSYSAPWTDFTEVNALTGDLGGRIIRLRSGLTIYDGLSILNASNFTIETYGGSAEAVIDGSAITAWTWVNEAGTDLWSTTGAGAQKAVYVGSVAYEMAQSDAALSQTVLDRAERTYWYGTHSTYGGGVKLWVHAEAGLNMSTESSAGRVRTTSENRSAYMSGCSAQKLQNIIIQRGAMATLQIYEQGDGLILDGLTVRQNGYSAAPVGMDSIDLSGLSAGVPATGVVIRNCLLDQNLGGTNNNALEVSYTDGLTVQDCTFRRIEGNAVEFWNTVHNGVVERCRFEDIGGSAWWLSGDAAGSYHTNNTIRNCVMNSTGNPRNDRGSAGQGSIFARIQSASNTKIYNNTYIGNAQQGLIISPSPVAASTNTITIKNNLFYNTHANGDSARIQTTGSVLGGDPAWTFVNALTGAKNEIVSDYNRFFSNRQAAQSGIKMGNINGVATSGLAAWQAQSGAPDSHSSEGDPSITSPHGPVTALTTTVTSGGTTGSWVIVVASVTGFALGDWITVKLDSATRTHVTRIAAIAVGTNTITMEVRLGSAAGSGKLVTRLSSGVAEVAPGATPPLNSGIGSATDANVPTTDFFGNPRSTTAPDIGAVEV